MVGRDLVNGNGQIGEKRKERAHPGARRQSDECVSTAFGGVSLLVPGHHRGTHRALNLRKGQDPPLRPTILAQGSPSPVHILHILPTGRRHRSLPHSIYPALHNQMGVIGLFGCYRSLGVIQIFCVIPIFCGVERHTSCPPPSR